MFPTRKTVLFMCCLLLIPALVACGTRPTAAPAATQESGTTDVSHPTEEPRPTEGPSPTEPPPPPTEGGAVKLPDVAEAYARVQNLPSFHFEGTFQGQQGGAGPQYLRLVQDVDAQGNMRLQAFDEEGGTATLDLYYVDKHLYMGGPNGRYIDMGVQDMQQVSTFYQLYQTPFTVALVGATDLEPMGQENVNGLTATKYQASFDEWVQTYIQVKQGISYTAEGFIWIADEYGAIVKSSVLVAVNEGGTIKSFSAESEVSQVGQVAPITAP
jgi:hypothetical protein